MPTNTPTKGTKLKHKRNQLQEELHSTKQAPWGGDVRNPILRGKWLGKKNYFRKNALKVAQKGRAGPNSGKIKEKKERVDANPL